MKNINFHNITHDDMLNGDGLRVVLWVSGCEHHCPGCQNPITWDPKIGMPLTEWEESEFWTWLSKPWTQGATFSGGDPLHPANRDKIGKMIEKINREYPEKDIWVYTGYQLTDDFKLSNAEGDLFELPYLENIDVLVDGRFELETRKKDLEIRKEVLWCGSSNQRVINVKESLKENKIVLK